MSKGSATDGSTVTELWPEELNRAVSLEDVEDGPKKFKRVTVSITDTTYFHDVLITKSIKSLPKRQWLYTAMCCVVGRVAEDLSMNFIKLTNVEENVYHKKNSNMNDLV